MFHTPKNAEIKITNRKEIGKKITEKYIYIEEMINYEITKYFVEYWRNNQHYHLCNVFYTEAEAVDHFNKNHEYGTVLDKVVKEISCEVGIVKRREKNKMGC